MLKSNELKSIGRTLKAGLASKKALKEVRRKAISAAIADGVGAGKDGAPLAKTTWRGYVQTQLLESFERIMDTDPAEFTPGWNYNADTQGAISGSAPFYVSVKDGKPVLSGSARIEWNNARALIDANVEQNGIDYDQSIREWLELPESEQYKAVKVESKPKKNPAKKFDPIVKMLVDAAMERGLTIKELKSLVQGTISAMDKVKKAKKAA